MADIPASLWIVMVCVGLGTVVWVNNGVMCLLNRHKPKDTP